MLSPFILLPLGVLAGAVGTLIGAGGGFILVPVLLALLPSETPGIITGISQVVVVINALSGTLIYARQRRIEYRWAGLLSVMGLAGMGLGAYITEQLSRERFQVVFGVAFLALAAYLFARPVRRGAARTLQEAQSRRIPLERRHVPLVAAVGLAVGTVGGLLGIGGGIVLVPILVQGLSFPAHMATATSQLVMLITSPAAIAVHTASAPLTEKAGTILVLGVGALLGAQLGARISRKVSGPWIVRTLAGGLAVAGVRLLIAGG